MACQDLFRGFLRKWWRSLEGGTKCHNQFFFVKNCHLPKKANYEKKDGKAKN